MSEEFLDLVSYAHEQFAEKNMLTWLYDEDRWPSGFGGGLVTIHPEAAAEYGIEDGDRRGTVSRKKEEHQSPRQM